MMRQAILVVALASSAAACSGADETELMLGGAELVEPDVIERVEVEGQVVEFIAVRMEGEDGTLATSVMMSQWLDAGELLIADRMRQAERRDLSPAEIYLGLTGKRPSELPDELADDHSRTGRELRAGVMPPVQVDKQISPGDHQQFFPGINGRTWIRKEFRAVLNNINGTYCGEWKVGSPDTWKPGANVSNASTCPATTFNEPGWLRIGAENNTSPTGNHIAIVTLCYGPSVDGAWACAAPMLADANQFHIQDWNHSAGRHMAYGVSTEAQFQFVSGKSIPN